MRLPSSPDALENKAATSDSVKRDPSYPDRARIDSDVRAFLRPVSTPWIVFDRDSRIDDFAKSALRVGAVFASAPSFRPELVEAAEELSAEAPVAEAPVAAPAAPAPAVVEAPSARPAMFPPTVGAPESVVEPSNLIVASDVMPDSSSAIALGAERAPFESAASLAPSFIAPRGRLAAIAAACAGVVAAASIAALVLAGGARGGDAAAETPANAPTAAAAAARVETAPAPEEAAAPGVEAAVTPEEAAPAASAAEPAKAPAAAKAPIDPKKRFGKLTIKADAKRKNVWFDGKRMLGSGQRSFLVFCGMHTIAVADKTETRDVEVPCNGEYVVSK